MGGLVKNVLGGITGGGANDASKASASQAAADSQTLGLTSQTEVMNKKNSVIGNLVTGSLASIK